MKAVYCLGPGGPEVLIDGELKRPEPRPHDLLVAVDAISVNPIDVKQRTASTATGLARPARFPDGPKVLGYDAAGTVVAVGAAVTRFTQGDEIYCMGAVNRPGTNAEFVAVDERLAARRPRNLTASQAAALPLTTLTAWELLFEGMRAPRLAEPAAAKGPRSLLVINGAGGVGSMLIQLAAQLTDLTIIATASRPESIDWVMSLGADHVIDHRLPLDESMTALGIPEAHYIASLSGTEANMQAITRLIAPHGIVGIIDAPTTLDIVPLKMKSAAMAWEGVFVRSLLQTSDMVCQHETLQQVSTMLDAGLLRSTMTKEMGSICAANVARAHEHIASGTAIGKAVLTGFE